MQAKKRRTARPTAGAGPSRLGGEDGWGMGAASSWQSESAAAFGVGATTRSKTWRCSVRPWTEEQLARLRQHALDRTCTKRAAMHSTPTALDALFIFTEPQRAAQLQADVLNAEWQPAAFSTAWSDMVQRDGVIVLDETRQGQRNELHEEVLNPQAALRADLSGCACRERVDMLEQLLRWAEGKAAANGVPLPYAEADGADGDPPLPLPWDEPEGQVEVASDDADSDG